MYLVLSALTSSQVSLVNCALTLLKSYDRPDLSLYTPHTKVTGFLLGFLTLEDGTDTFSRNVG